MTTPEDLAVLQQIADLVDAAEGDATDTAALAAATGRATFGPPWFELRDPLTALQQEGLLEIRPAHSEPQGPDQPSPPAERLELVVTDAGRTTITPRNSR